VPAKTSLTSGGGVFPCEPTLTLHTQATTVLDPERPPKLTSVVAVLDTARSRGVGRCVSSTAVPRRGPPMVPRARGSRGSRAASPSSGCTTISTGRFTFRGASPFLPPGTARGEGQHHEHRHSVACVPRHLDFPRVAMRLGQPVEPLGSSSGSSSDSSPSDSADSSAEGTVPGGGSMPTA